ncbi:MAG: SNF2-related protein [Candidatus Helarchaeota archaeon]
MSEKKSLRDYPWKKTYKSIHGNLVRDFFIPALERSILYRRVAGYFSSSVLVAAAAGIARLLINEGKMQLIVGAQLNPEDVKAINRDLSKIPEIISNKIPEDFNDLNELEKFIYERRFDALSWMIYNKKLEIKVALVLDENNNIAENQDLDPYFHDKWGIFYDQEGNYIGFIGSVNESRQGWLKNHERIKVFRSWDNSIEYLEDDIDDFMYYWNGFEPGLKVYDITEAINRKLIRYRSQKPPSKDPIEIKNVFLKEEEDSVVKQNKILGIYDGLNFMNPEEFKFKQIASFIDAIPGLQHNWNSLLNTIAFKPMYHQEIIAYEIYKNYPRGYILCDEVGLGKTIEAGLAIKWLILAGRIKRVLIIVPKNIVKQWQEELREKFNLEFYIYDGKNLINYWDEKFISKTLNPYNAVDLVLVSSGLVQLEKRKIELINAIDWDLIIFDEAHHLRRKPPKRIGGEGAPTRLLSLAQDLKKKTKSFLLLTATPIQMRIQELFDLLKLLGLGGKWGQKENFDKFYKIISQKVENRNKKDWEFLVEMAKDFLKWGRINKDFYENELFQFGGKFQSDFKNIFVKDYDFLPYLEEKIDDKEYLKEFSYELEALSPLRWFMFRNTRNQLKEYGIHVPIRKPKDESIDMNPEERKLYKEIETYLREIYKKSTPEQRSIIGFTLAIYRRRLTSSFYAIKKTLEKRLNFLKYERDGKKEKMEKLFDDEDIDDDLIEEYDINISDIEFDIEKSNIDILEEYKPLDLKNSKKRKEKIIFLAKDSLDEEIEYLEQFIYKINDFLKRNQESKFERFKSLLEEANLKDAKRILVFTQYTDTLKFLRKKLKNNPNYQNIACYSGKGGELLIKNNYTEDFEWQPKSKEDIKNWFFEEGDFKILICTDAASEGLNFQVCNYMINYDLPWNPMKVEQRIGRIDRVQQMAEELYIYNLIYNETIEGRIYKKLWERIRLFQNTIGPLRPILNVYQKAEKFAIEEGDDALTEEEIEKLLGNIKEETERAQIRHDFFIKLLRRRISPEIEIEKEKPLIINLSEYFKWIKMFFELKDKNIFKNLFRNSFKLINQDEYSLTLALVYEKGSILFNKNNNLIKRKTVKIKRNLNNLPYIFSITHNPDFFAKYPSNYYFNYHCEFFSNFLNYFLPHKEKFLPAVIKKINEHNDILKNALIITRIIFSRYPLFNKEKFYLIELDLQTWEIINEFKIENFNQLKEINDKIDFIRKLTQKEINVYKIRNTIRDFIKKIILEKSKKNLKFEEFNDLFNWDEIKKSFKAMKESFKNELKTNIIKFLIMEYLFNNKDENWKNFPDKIFLEDYYDILKKIDGWKKIERILANLDIEIERIKISSNHEIFINLVHQYKKINRRKLLKADQARLKNRILNLIEKFNEDMKVYNSRKMEYIRLTKINNPQILICGLILK